MDLASFFQRLVALTIDCVLLQIIGSVVTYPLERKLPLAGEDMKQLLSGGVDLSQVLIALILYTTLLTVLWGFYFTYFIGTTGQTPGKKLMHIAVVRVDGQPLDFRTAFNRFVGYSFSSIFFLGFIWALFDRNNQTWHDKMSHTLVVKQKTNTLA